MGMNKTGGGPLASVWTVTRDVSTSAKVERKVETQKGRQ
jgi:hypothetical protein